MSMPAGPQGGPAVKMTVQPEEVVRLMHRLEAVRGTVESFIRDNSDALRGQPFAEDDVSQDAALDFAANADSATEVARQFVDQLTNTILGLKDAAATYNLVDDTHATDMQKLTKDH